MTIEEKMLSDLKLKPQDVGITAFLEDFAKKNDMKHSKANGIYYNGVRTDYEKWLHSKQYWSGKKQAEPAKTEGADVRPEVIKELKKAKVMPLETPEVVTVKDPVIQKLRIAYLEQKLRTVKDPTQRIIIEPWLQELKEGVCG